MQRLIYLATRDELTGHLNRNALRGELAAGHRSGAAPKNRACAFLVASIDRLAMINEAYGFDAADEVIVAVGERIARSLRGSDIIGRIAGNKLGVILANCSEREIGARRRTPARHRARSGDRNALGHGVGHDLRGCGVAAVGCGLQPGSDAARRGSAGPRARRGRDGFARLRQVAAARNRAPAPDGALPTKWWPR